VGHKTFSCAYQPMVLRTPSLMRRARASESRTAQVSLERRKLRVVEDIGMLLWIEIAG
jgi:hypothetical protein